MGELTSYQSLLALLREFGVKVIEDGDLAAAQGFPVALPLAGGETLVLDLPDPALLGSLDPDAVGAAVLDSFGYVTKAWGLARRSPYLQATESSLLTPLSSIINNAFEGATGTLYLDGMRYFVAGIQAEGPRQALILVTSAQEEKAIRQQSNKSMRAAAALKRVGKALTMDQRMQQLCLSAVHEIASVGELASVLLWTAKPEDTELQLTASVGVNRHGTTLLTQLHSKGGSSCIAELVASSRQPFFLNHVSDHMMTADLEAKFCYLPPGGVAVFPLVISDKLLGVLELVSREDDEHFPENQELFATVAEHLALALNSAFLFESFEKMASHDALTGIANHRTMQEFLQRRFAEAQRTGQELGILMIDVDHFRSFNEEEGHDAGDEVLRLVAEALRASVRPYDLAARYGGEEFTVVMPGSSMASSLAVAERIRKRVSHVSFTTASGRERHVTVSIGCAGFPKNAKDSGSLLKAADSALYTAKRGGRNKVVVYKGLFNAGNRSDKIGLEKVWDWVPEQDREAAEALQNELSPYTSLLRESVPLSKAQEGILNALILFATTYRRIKSEQNDGFQEALESWDDFRILQPSLDALEERYDGTGPMGLAGHRIPLLARVLAVLLAIAEERGRSLLEDPSRYDPEILSIVSELDDAA